MNLNKFKNLSKEQLEAVLSDNNDILVAAGPGSGKTVVIVNRVYNLIHYKNIKPQNIIVITFTKSAAANMKNRYLSMCNDKVAPFFGTFHGLFYKILTSFYGEIKIISSGEAFKLIKSFLTTYLDEVSEDKVRDVLNAISVFKCANVNMEDFETSLEKSVLKNSYEIYESYKKERNLYDFEDLQIECKNLFIKRPRLLDSYRGMFKYILIDEFQDCDTIQLDILKLLKGDNNIFAVGDEDQCIYSFRGSRPDFMVNFNEIFPSSKTLFLSTNYRSVANIVEFSMSCIKNNKLRNHKIIVPFKEALGTIKIPKVYSENLQGDYISNEIQLLKESTNKQYKDFAVIYRTNVESRSIVDSLIRKKVPFKLLDKEYNFFEHFICKDILSFLRLSIDPFHMESFIRIINKPYRYVSKTNLEIIKKDMSYIDCFEKLKNIETVPIFQLKTIDKLKKDISTLNKMSLFTAVEFIISDIGYHNYLVEYCSKYKIQIDDFENILQEFKDALEGYNSIINFLTHVEVVTEEINKSANLSKDEDAVMLSTIHGVKGMEFSDVYIINLVEGLIPHENNKGENVEEERRLFYVAITRAINNLTLMIPSLVQGKVRQESRFISECNLLKNHIVNEFEAGNKILHKNFGLGEVLKVEQDTIYINFDNGNERRFDLRVLMENKLIQKCK